MKKRIIYSYLCKMLACLLLCSSSAMAAAAEMEDGDAFKIKYATQKMQVRTIDGRYVESTWEQAIPNQGLAEKIAKDGCNINPAGMCCSHAVVCALEYCHNRSDLLASYLHKAVTGGYAEGMHLKPTMNFVKDSGVMALPPNQTVKSGSGLPWPDGVRYKFSNVIDANNFNEVDGINRYPNKATRYIAALKYHDHPIVVEILSGYKGRPELSPFIQYRGRDDIDRGVIMVQDNSASIAEDKLYHAIILYGFRKSTQRFFVKNSWGTDYMNGLCTLPYDYFNKFSRSAFIGLGHNDAPMKQESIFERPFDLDDFDDILTPWGALHADLNAQTLKCQISMTVKDSGRPEPTAADREKDLRQSMNLERFSRQGEQPVNTKTEDRDAKENKSCVIQ